LYVWPDGRRYEGLFENDKYHGNGTFTFPNGDKIEFHWMYGYAEGEGRRYNAASKTWDKGFMVNGKFATAFYGASKQSQLRLKRPLTAKRT